MVELLDGFPSHVAAYRARGRVHADEYRQVVMRRIDEVAAAYGKVDFLVLLETGFQNYSPGAFVNYCVISFKHFTRWRRMAIVTDQAWLGHLYECIGLVVPGTIRSYPIDRFPEAKQWVSYHS
ncbi:MAG TPA: STAS/SEC14 domain-containing protein [Flavipsychrobacter sp.]